MNDHRAATTRVLDLARTCHEAHRAFCAHIGDDSQPAWGAAPEWLRNSAVDGVLWRADNIDATDEESHDAWRAKMADEGWVFGAVKSAESDPKTHPALVPFADLAAGDRFKTRLFRTIVLANVGRVVA